MRTFIDKMERVMIGTAVLVACIVIYALVMVGIEETFNCYFYDWSIAVITAIVLVVSMLLSNEAQFAFVGWQYRRRTKLYNDIAKEVLKGLEGLDKEN